MFAYYLLDLKKKKKKLENIPNKYTQTELLLKHGLSEGKTSSWDSRSQFFEPNLICTVTNIRLTRNPVTEELQEKEKINNKNKEIVNMKFKCDQCNFTGILPIMPLVPGYSCSVPGYPGSIPACPESVPECL